MDILFAILVVVCAIGFYLCFLNSKLRREIGIQQETLSDLLVERDDLRKKLKDALKNDKRNAKTGRYTK